MSAEVPTTGFRLSPQQLAVWRAHRAHPELATTAVAAVALRGELDRESLGGALGDLIAEHEILRTVFRRLPELKEPVQEIAEPVPVSIELEGSAPEPASELERLFEAESRRRAELEARPALRARLVALGPGEHVLVLAAPALCLDLASLELLVAGLARRYAARAEGLGESAEPLQLADLAEWQHELLEGEETAEERAYWRGFDPEAAAFEPPWPCRREKGPSLAHHRIELPPELWAEIGAAAERRGSSPASWLAAAWHLLLGRISGRAEVWVGHLADGRSYEELEAVLGPLAHALPVTLPIRFGERFEELPRRLDELVGEAGDWQEYFTWPAEADPAGFAATFEFVPAPESHAGGGVEFEILRRRVSAGAATLGLSCHEAFVGMACELAYDAVRSDRAEIERTARRFAELLRRLVAEPDVRLGELDVLTAGERQRLVAEWNDGAAEPGEECFHHLFERWAERTPTAPALVFEDRAWSYAELESRANRLAHRLRRAGVGPEVGVGLLLERSGEVVVSLLAVLKAGGAYLPLDPAQPRERLSTMLEGVSAEVLITETRWGTLLGDGPWHRIDLDAEALDEEPETRPASGVTAGHLAYFLFTSGSTGRPRGVAVEHRQLVAYTRAISARLGLEAGATYTAASTFAADLGNTAIHPALAGGGCLHVLSPERIADPNALAAYFERHPIDLFKIVPSHFRTLLRVERPERIVPRRRLVLGGEACPREWVERVRELSAEVAVYNHYGPTETTVGVLAARVEAGAPALPGGGIELGRPLDHARVYLLDGVGRPVPTWTPGEIAIGGAAPARGYVGDPRRTAERFRPDPAAERAGARRYHTGDRARFLPGGELEFSGRFDHQVKIRGYRIEPGEIEALLGRHPGVRAAAVVARGEAVGERGLVAYVELGEVGVDELRRDLAERLPDYMLPSAFVSLKRLPRNANGKIDRRALPAPEAVRPELEATFVAPESELERLVAEIWREVLSLPKVGVHDNFFDLGGHSLALMDVGLRLQREIGREIPILDLFQHPTVAKLAALLAGGDGGRESETREAGERGGGRRRALEGMRRRRERRGDG